MSERMRKEADGQEYNRQVKPAWAIVTVQGILDNDFYIGTLRQGKYTRAKINGKDVKRDDEEHIVIENHHQAIIDYRTFATTMALREKRTRSNYRGIKINDNVYSGFLRCGDCGSPMFSMSRKDLKPAYTCGTYHRRGIKGCTSHHICVEKLDELLKIYVEKLMENSAAMVEELNRDLAKENDNIAETEQSADHLAEILDDLMEEMRITKRQRIREIMKKPEQEEMIEATYDEMEAELQKKIDGLNHQIDILSDKRNTYIRVNRTAKTALEVFDDILHKDKLERNDLELLIDRILVYEDHLEIKLQADIDSLLHCGTIEECKKEISAANFNFGTGNIENIISQSSKNHGDKVFRVNVVSNGDPLEIYTDREGEVIFKKYSPIGELASFATQYAETLYKTCNLEVVICDRDAVIACAGVPKKEYIDKKLGEETENTIEKRQLYSVGENEGFSLIDGGAIVGCLMPIIAEGDITGCVASLRVSGGKKTDPELEAKLIQTAAEFLGKQLES